MKTVLIYLLGAATACSWWAAAIYEPLETSKGILWAVAVLLSIGSIAGAFAIAQNEP